MPCCQFSQDDASARAAAITRSNAGTPVQQQMTQNLAKAQEKMSQAELTLLSDWLEGELEVGNVTFPAFVHYMY